MRVVLQEGNHVVWVTRGHKLYRVAPEHLRPLSAMEEWNHQRHNQNNENQETQAMRQQNFQSIFPPYGGIQYHILIPSNPEQVNKPSAHNPPYVTMNNPHNIPSTIPTNETPAEVPESNQSDQPDVEPVPSSHDSTAKVFPETNPIEVPVPDDDELFVQDETVLHVDNDQCWKLEVDISSQDISNWKAADRPAELTFIATAAKRQRSEVKLAQLTAADREKFHQAKLKEIDSWISTETITKIPRNQIPKENVLRCR